MKDELDATQNTKGQWKKRAKMQGHGDNQQQQHIQEGSKCVNWKRGSMEIEHGQEKLKK